MPDPEALCASLNGGNQFEALEATKNGALVACTSTKVSSKIKEKFYG